MTITDELVSQVEVLYAELFEKPCYIFRIKCKIDGGSLLGDHELELLENYADEIEKFTTEKEVAVALRRIVALNIITRRIVEGILS